MTISTLIFSLILSIPAVADVWREDYGTPPIRTQINTQGESEYNWLYELLIPEKARADEPDRALKSFRVHLRDTLQVFPHPDAVASKNLTLVESVTGKITYVGFFRKRYAYDIFRTPSGELVHTVRVHFQNASGSDLVDLERKLSQAQEIWQRYRVPMDFSYSFKFEVAAREEDAHFSVELRDDTRGPYDQYWGRNWTGDVIAHELGHMLGLGDEYETLTGKMDCLDNSLMCASWSGELMPHHYYFVLRRLVTP
jgi:hypothetical protein